MRIGYERVSTESQSTLRQDDMMLSQELDKVYIEKVSGKDRNRPKLKKMLESLQEGDVVIIESISRMSRSTRDFLNILHELEEKKVSIISLKEKLDTETPAGRMMVTVLAAMAQFERESLLIRQREGIDAQKKRGIYKGGRPRIRVDQSLLTWVKTKWRLKELEYWRGMEMLGVSMNTFYRIMKDSDENRWKEESS